MRDIQLPASFLLEERCFSFLLQRAKHPGSQSENHCTGADSSCGAHSERPHWRGRFSKPRLPAIDLALRSLRGPRPPRAQQRVLAPRSLESGPGRAAAPRTSHFERALPPRFPGSSGEGKGRGRLTHRRGGALEARGRQGQSQAGLAVPYGQQAAEERVQQRHRGSRPLAWETAAVLRLHSDRQALGVGRKQQTDEGVDAQRSRARAEPAATRLA